MVTSYSGGGECYLVEHNIVLGVVCFPFGPGVVSSDVLDGLTVDGSVVIRGESERSAALSLQDGSGIRCLQAFSMDRRRCTPEWRYDNICIVEARLYLALESVKEGLSTEFEPENSDYSRLYDRLSVDY